MADPTLNDQLTVPEITGETKRAWALDEGTPLEQGTLENAIEENIMIPARDLIDNVFQGDKLGKDEIRFLRERARAKGDKSVAEFQEEAEGSLPSEAVKLGTGGLIDAAESAGAFADLTGDTLKLGLNQLLGKPTNPGENPFSPDYEHNSWFEVPDHLEPENVTAIGKFGRALVEFGLLTRWTGAVGSVFRAPSAAVKGPRNITFIDKAIKIGSEGAIAEFIMQSSEYNNIINLANEHVPHLVPDIVQALAIDPDDNPWLARLKTTLAGAGMNYLAHGIGALAKGFWSAGKARFQGLSIDEANAIGNKAMGDDITVSLRLDEEESTKMAASRFIEGNGVTHSDPLDDHLRTYLDPEEYNQYTVKATDEGALDEFKAVADERANEAGNPWDDMEGRNLEQSKEALSRDLDPFVNPDQFDSAEKATYRSSPNAIKKEVIEATKSADAKGHQVIAPESYVRAVARGNADIKELVDEVLEEMADQAFSKGDNTLSHKEIIEAGFRRAEPYLNEIEAFADGKRIDLAVSFKKMLENEKEFRLWGYENGELIQTVGPSVRDANLLVLNSLGKLVSNLSRGAMEISNDMPFIRQFDAITDAMKVVFRENKKYSLLWGLDGQTMQKGFLKIFNKQAKETAKSRIEEALRQADEFVDSLKSLGNDGRFEEAAELIEMFKLSDGAVRTQAHMLEFLNSRLLGGRMVGKDGRMVSIKGRFMNELWGTFYNSILSRPRTGIKAVSMTNLVSIMRPLQISVGLLLPGRYDKKQIALAAVQWDSMFRSYKESWEMAVRNYQLGSSRKSMDFQGKFDVSEDIKQWKALAPYYAKHGNLAQQLAYNFIDKAVDFNTSPWVRFNQNAMGAGDAFARTTIGRQYLALQAAQKATELGVDLRDLPGWVSKNEELFRKEIFKKNKDGVDIVTDKAAKLAGDEAALTNALEENFRGFEMISNIPGMKAFISFARPGFHALDLSFKHTAFGIFKNKYRDIVIHGRNLEQYGIRPENLAQERALLEGRIAMGSALTGAMVYAAAQGRLIGDYPHDKETRDLWIANGIVPNSFAYPTGKGWLYFSYQNIEVFNTLFSMVGNIVGQSDVLGEQLTDEWLTKVSFITSAVIVENSMLQGMEGLFTLFDSKSPEEYKSKFLGRTARSFIPFSGLSADIGDVVDGTQKEYQTLLETLVRRDAFIRNVLPPKYDILSKDRSGKPLKTGPHNPLLRLFNSLSPVAITYVEGDPIKESLLEIRYNLPAVLSSLQGEPLNTLETSELQRYLSMSPTLRPRLEKIINNPEFQNTLNMYKGQDLKIKNGYNYKDTWFYRAVDSVFIDEKKIAKARMLADHQELQERIIRRKQKQYALRSGRKDRVDKLLNMPNK